MIFAKTVSYLHTKVCMYVPEMDDRNEHIRITITNTLITRPSHYGRNIRHQRQNYLQRYIFVTFIVLYSENYFGGEH